MKKALLAAVSLLLVALAAASALAAPPEAKLPYQKKLTAAPTASATSTPVAFTFTLWDAETAGTQKWIDIKSIPVTSTTRLISTVLGDAAPLNATDFNQQLWVQVESNGQVIGTRDKLVAVPYALWSATSDVPGVPGPQGPKGDKGDPGNSIVGPAGPGLASLDALRGLPCNVGVPYYAGTVAIAYDLQGATSISCNYPKNRLTVTARSQGTSYTYSCNCMGWLNGNTCGTCTGYNFPPIFVTSSPAGISCAAGGTGLSSNTCTYDFPVGMTITLTDPNVTFGGACSGTGSCTVVMDGPKTVTADR